MENDNGNGNGSVGFGRTAQPGPQPPPQQPPRGLPRDNRALHPLALPAIWLGALSLVPMLRIVCLAPILFWFFGSPPAADDKQRRGRLWMIAGAALGGVSLIYSLILAAVYSAGSAGTGFIPVLVKALTAPDRLPPLTGGPLPNESFWESLERLRQNTVFDELSPAILLAILVLIIAVVLHEIAHGWAARRYGDPTATELGRLSLNPVRHFDAFGTFLLPGMLALFGSPVVFGYAKPVPVDPRRFHSDPWRGMAEVSVAGPATNLLQALIWGGLIQLIGMLAVSVELGGAALPLAVLFTAAMYGLVINLFLGILNMIPVPPLDGSKVLAWVMPKRQAIQFLRVGRFGFIALVALLYLGFLDRVFIFLLKACEAIYLPSGFDLLI